LALIAGSACAAVLGLSRLAAELRAAPPAATAAPVSAPCPAAPTGSSLAQARSVANLFIDHAVLRVRPECSFELVAPRLRHGVSRADWAAGKLPLETFHTAFHNVSRTAAIRVTLPRELGMWVFLEAPDVGRRAYELVLVRRGNRWIVDYWGETFDPTGPAVPMPEPTAPAGAGAHVLTGAVEPPMRRRGRKTKFGWSRCGSSIC
jgi:hypothetical protein